MNLRKSVAPNVAMNIENNSVRRSEKPTQIGNYPGSTNSMFDGPQAENEHMNRPLINRTAGNETRNEEFHWMAYAAYNQSK